MVVDTPVAIIPIFPELILLSQYKNIILHWMQLINDLL